jgi:ATP-dependent DNA helicase RecG
MDAHAVQSLLSGRGQLDPSAQIVSGAVWQDLDPLEFERFRRSIRERRGRSDETLLELSELELAKALGVVDANGSVRGVRLAALLLFGKEEGCGASFLPMRWRSRRCAVLTSRSTISSTGRCCG